MAFIDDLNPAQQAAVLYNEGPHLVIAGAGSGKTRVLTYKIAYLLHKGVAAQNILALTFTNKAAREMKQRISGLVGAETARYLFMGTFHSIFARLIRQEADRLGYTKDFSIYDTGDSKNLLKQIVKEMQEDEKVYKPGDLLGKISEAKNLLVSASEYARNSDYQVRDRMQRHYRMAEIYQIYQRRLQKANAMDFDDLLYNMNVLLEKCPDIREKYQQHFQYILVDEYQDTNYSQYRIIKHLAEPQRQICVVGDDAQSIYSFRGADIRNILAFQDEYEGCKLFKLERNYRSTQNIVNAANSLIEKNEHQIQKEVYSENGVGQRLQVSGYSSDRDEGKFVAEKVYMLKSLEHRDYNQFAVLYRTNAQSRVLEDEMRKAGIPYRLYGSTSFYQRKEIKDVLSFFRLLANPMDEEALLRAVKESGRGIGETTMKKVSQAALDTGLGMFQVMQHPLEVGLDVNAGTQKKLVQFAYMIEQLQPDMERMDAYEFALKVMQTTGVTAMLAAGKSQEDLDRLENVKELQAAIHEYADHQKEAGEDSTILGFLQEVALLTDQDEKTNDQTPRVTLMTVHAAKGLEYEVVFVVGMETDIFPSAFCQTLREMEEERRLFYVAITRAKEECYITYARSRFKNGQVMIQSESPFLKDIDGRYMERVGNEQPRQHQWRNGMWDDDDWTPRSSRTDVEWNKPNMPRRISVPSVPDTSRFKPTTGVHVNEEEHEITAPWPNGTRVRHAKFGDGTIVRAYSSNGNEKVDVEFDTQGMKAMIIKFAKFEVIGR